MDNNSENERGRAANQSISMMIKNTFLDFGRASLVEDFGSEPGVIDLAVERDSIGPAAAAGMPRRCSSAPCSPRGRVAAKAEFCSERLSFKKGSSDGSTTSCTGEDSEGETTSSDKGAFVNGGTEAEAAATEVASQPPPPPVAPDIVRTPLRTVLKARAWTPFEGRDKDVQTVVETVKHRVQSVTGLVSMSSEWNTTATATGTPAGMCTLTLMVAVDASQSIEQVVMYAQQVILASVAEVPRLYVIGKRSTPFVQTSQGFAVMVGVVEDMSRACGDAYAGGFCARGASCQWQHPTVMTHININVVPVQGQVMYMVFPVEVDSYSQGCEMQGYFPGEGMTYADEYGNAFVAQEFGYERGHY